MAAPGATSARRAAPATRRDAVLRRVVVAVALLLAAIHLAAVPVHAKDAERSTAVALVDDDGGLAMFDERDMAPGTARSACIAVSTTGSAESGREVSLSADISQADLAPYLHVTVDMGTTGGYGDCTAFTGRQVWSGFLADMPPATAAGLPTGWRPAEQDRAVFRITTSVADTDSAQDRSAEASFHWSLPSDGAAVAPKPDDEPRTQPPKVEKPELSPAGAPERPDIAERPDIVQAPPLEAEPSLAAKVLNAVVGAAKTVVGVLKQGHFPIGLLLVIAGFIALQGALDRRDPKLALARVREEFAEFEDFPARIGGPR